MASSALPQKMRAAQWTAPPIEATLQVNDVPLPKEAHNLPKDAALIKVAYASINPVDYKLPENGIARTVALGRGPWTPGADFAGTVVSSNIAHVKPGDRVAGCLGPPTFATLAEYVVVKGAINISLVPDGVDLKDAASLGVASQTALQCLSPYIKSGAKVLVNGASGGTGSFGVQFAKILGCTVTGVCSGANVELVKSLGADEVIDYKAVDVIQELTKGGQQYDLIIDNVAVGGPLFVQSHHYLKEGGRYVSIAGGPDLGSIKGMLSIFAQPSWLGGARRKGAFVGRVANREELDQILGWIKEGKLRPFIEKVYELEESVDAFKRLKSGRTRGKLVIKVADA